MRIRGRFVIAGTLLLNTPCSGGDISARPDPRRARELAVMGYQGLATELGSEHGAYLRSLEELLGVRPEDATVFEGQLRQLLKQYPNIMDFADQVVALKLSI